jgi:hypothetical protein
VETEWQIKHDDGSGNNTATHCTGLDHGLGHGLGNIRLQERVDGAEDLAIKNRYDGWDSKSFSKTNKCNQGKTRNIKPILICTSYVNSRLEFG